jgi:hypothetical protein
MSKDRKQQEKRRQKKIAKQKANRGDRVAAFKAEQAQRAAHRKKIVDWRGLLKGAVSVPPLSDEDYTFWLCHGANYLASDSEQGIWAPLFEDIYQGRLPPPESIAQRVLHAYQAQLEAEGKFGGIPRAVLAWTVTDRQVVSVYKHEAVRRLAAKNPGGDVEALARSPHNPVVWGMMDQVKARSLAAGDKLDAEQEVTPPVPVEETTQGESL